MYHQIVVREYEGSIPKNKEAWRLDPKKEEQRKSLNSFPLQLFCRRQEREQETSFLVRAEVMGVLKKPISIAFQVVEEEWDEEGYVFFPAAVYNGNRFESLLLPYPPYHAEKKKDGWNQVITDIPHLGRDGEPSRIQLLSGDMSAPANGFYSWKKQEGVLLLAKHKIGDNYTGFSVYTEGEKGILEVSLPGVRERTKYFFGELPDGRGFYPTMEMASDDWGMLPTFGERMEMEGKLYRFKAETLMDYFRSFNNLREGMETGRPFETVPFSKVYEEIRQKYLERCFDPEGYFRVGTDNDTPPSHWQAGWVGGGMNTLAFILEGQGQAYEYAVQNLVFITEKLQRENGWYIPMYAKGRIYGDDFRDTDKPVLLVRKDANLLYFLLKQALVLKDRQALPVGLEESMKKQADAFVRFYEKNGQMGQFIDMEKEELIQGDTASAAMVPAALSLAYEYFGAKAYLDTAKELGRLYWEDYLKRGIVNGGPGEICQAPDSESSFALLESFVQLYETTGEEEWLRAAKEAFELAITWVASYDFCFPKGSEAGKLGCHSRGTVFANAQNKHSAPGICTLSGNSILKLYHATGEKRYLKWLSYISHALPQFTSLKERPIRTLDGRVLPPGFMNERVQTSDWEGKETVGGFLYGDNWPDVSMMLTYAEVPGVYVDLKEKSICCLDHVQAAWDGSQENTLRIKNPCHYPAKVTVLADSRDGKPLGHLYRKAMKQIEIGAGGEVSIQI